MPKRKELYMTDPQRQLAADNHNLIFGYMSKSGLDEDWYGILAEALCYAAVNYDDSKGAGFSTFAYNTMRLRCMREVGSINTMDVRKANFEAVSLDAPQRDTIHAPRDVEQTAIARVMISNALDRLAGTEKRSFVMHITGYTNEEIGEKYGVSRQTISNRLRSARRKMVGMGV